MKRILIVCTLALSLTGCAGMVEKVLDLPTGVLTTSISNPVTPDMLYKVESGLIVAVSAANVYKRQCVAKTIDQRCRDVVKTLQSYTRRSKPLLKSLRAFVRNNDQVNASVAFNTIRQLISDFRSTAAANGVVIAGGN